MSLGLATITEIVLFLWSWTCYAVMTIITVILISLHKVTHTGKVTGRKILLTVLSDVLTSLMKLFILFMAIPWIILNADTGLEFKRQQSWLLLIQFSRMVKFLIRPLGLLVSPLVSNTSLPGI